MKLAQIIYTGFGGLGSVAFSLIDADAARQHRWIMGFIGNVPIDTAYRVRCAASNVAWKEFRSRAGRPFRAWLALARWLAEEKPEAIILHSINSIVPCRLYAWWRRIPLIAVEHTPNGVKTRSEWAFSRLAMVLADRVVLLTPEYREALAKAQRWLFRPSKVSIIPNGIDTGLFRPSARGACESARVRLGMAARFSFSKGQKLLVEMVRILKAVRPSIKWELSLAGDGEEFDSVKNLVSALGLEGEVRLEGVLDEPCVSRWLQGLYIYVHASQGETLSTSLLQAMATGLPIVASEVPGISNLLADDELGVLAPNDPEKFAESILALLDDAPRRERLARRVRQEAVAKYSSARMLEDYLDLLTVKVERPARQTPRATA